MTGLYDTPIVRFAGRVQAPLLQLYALYVLLHGDFSPGGGFQAGAALAASYLILRISEGYPGGLRGLTSRRATLLAYIGVFVYAGTGALSLMLGGHGFLDYSGLHNLPWPMPRGAATRAVGSMMVEVGVTMTVMGTMISLYDDLVAKPLAARSTPGPERPAEGSR